MRFQFMVATLVVGAACFVAQSDNWIDAQEENQEEDRVGITTFDFSLLDVPEGKDEAFYSEAFDKIIKELKPAKGLPASALIPKLAEKMPSAMKTIYEGLENATENKTKQKGNEAFSYYVDYMFQRSNDINDIRAIYEEEKALGKSRFRISEAYVQWFDQRVKRAKTKEDYKAIIADVVVNINELDSFALLQISIDLLILAPNGVENELKDLLGGIIRGYAASEDKFERHVVDSLEGSFHFLSLLGNEMRLEGLCLDKTELDWNSYRGKVVLVDFWATWCGPCVAEIPNVLALYEKYRDAGFEVVSYSVDDDLGELEKFEEEKKLPWKTVSQKLSLEAKENGGKEYFNPVKYYGIASIPTMVLIGKDGKTIHLKARGDELKRLLEEQFPDVK
ncbi:MAG: TlpA family protein disulfide reductase [Thermoguttaceae bacterium]|nr:TlpA family protein disulfide reductase [Thermoguttaceae bacterium]